ncbi:methyltransferase domain-containing protein [Candidatus Dojkabacteria bacterium]|uniref:Methyltransferase domain-containing protein n=1 Tax=Candidatus Dojkabacteria bacterium TaxID=2099670 RepID=A0A955LB51_9BACT|nr:methyltransferase domain-containing protein [Candidatus Dojkabacteria bacterium]
MKSVNVFIVPTTVPLPKKPKGHKKEKRDPSRIINNITFFGDSAIPADDPIYTSVFDAARLLAQNNYKIVNGGGPGLMKAATDGAESVNGNTVAIYWEPKLASIFEGKNLANVADETESQSNYINRTFGLIEEGDAYVVCKGGTGTVSEFGLVWALAKLYFGAHKPVILYGDFWSSLIDSFKSQMNIDEKELGVLYYANKPEEVLQIIRTHEMKLDKTLLKKVNGDEAAFLLKPSAKQLAALYDSHAHAYHSDNAKKLVAKDQLDEFIGLINAPAHVLDIGCGPGFDASYLADKYSVTAIEISKRFVQMARFENPNVDVIHADITNYDLPQSTYKGIWARDSLHHIHSKDLDKTFKKIAEALVEGGILYVIVREGSGEIVEKETKSYAELERFYHFFTAQELQDRAEKAGLELIKIDHTKRSHKWLVGVFKKS